ncbi:MAG: LysR substrate-binding domain-containing protein [Alphaproteobacteria bacterium]|nr:LysR substrate-binding domain-containing protein [Alphaproteobacteria bacterium]
MDLSDLRIFRAVVEEGGVTRAAQRLHRVQSNVTTRVRQLEEDLGVPLFIREGKRLHLAPAGQILVDYADRMLSLADEAREAVQDPRPRGVLRLGSMESTAAVRLPGPLSEYYRRFPEVTVELRTGNPVQLATGILAGEIDAALVAGPIPDGPFDKAVVFEEKLVIVAAADHPPIDGQDETPPSMVAFEVGCPHRRWLEEWYRDRGQIPERTIEMTSYQALLGCVLVGMGITLLPNSVLNIFPAHERLSVHPLPSDRNRAETVLIWRKGAMSPKISALLEVLTGSDKTDGTDGKRQAA